MEPHGRDPLRRGFGRVVFGLRSTRVRWGCPRHDFDFEALVMWRAVGFDFEVMAMWQAVGADVDVVHGTACCV